MKRKNLTSQLQEAMDANADRAPPVLKEKAGVSASWKACSMISGRCRRQVVPCRRQNPHIEKKGGKS